MPAQANTTRRSQQGQRPWSLTARTFGTAVAATQLPLGAVVLGATIGDLSDAQLVGLSAVASAGGCAALLASIRLRMRPVDDAARRLRRFVNLGVLDEGGPYRDDELGRLLAQVDDVCLRLDDAREEAERAATVDHLTGALTRRATEERLGELVRRARRWDDHLTLALVDVDRFKLVNDELGHAAGDAALCAVVGQLQRSLRGVGLVGRWGGDELLVVVRGRSEEVAAGLDRVRASIGDRVERVVGRRVTVSIGVAELRRHETVGACLAIADGGLYLAKAQGRDRVVDATADVLALPS